MVGWMSEIFLICACLFSLVTPILAAKPYFRSNAQIKKQFQHIHYEYVGIVFLFTECPYLKSQKKVYFCRHIAG